MSNSTITLRNLATFTLRSIWLSLLILTVECGLVWAQRSATDGSTPLALSPGAPAGSFAVSGFETVNAYNGSLSFRLPLLQIGGRGSAGYTLSLPLETHWRTVHRSNDQQTIELPVLDWWNLNRRRYGAGQLQGRVGTDSDHPCPPLFHVTTLLSRLTFTAPDGTEYELRDQLTNGKPQTYFCGGGQPYPSRGTVFVTSDGTAATFISDSTILDDGSVSVPSGYLSLRDGTRYRIVKGDVIWMRDRNGNQLNFAYADHEMTVTDSLNRQVKVAYADFLNRFSDEISYRGFGGAARTIRVNYAPLQNALRTNRPGDLSATQSTSGLFPQIINPNGTQVNPYVTASVVLPDGVRQYQFLYNIYGELARVALPTGGAFEYDFGNGALGDDATGVIWSGNSLPEIYRRVLRRRVYLDQGFTLESLTTYSRPEVDTPGYVEVNHFKSDQTTLLARERHYFYGIASSSFDQGALDYSSWRDGKEYQTDYFTANGQTLLKRVTQTWAQRAVTWWIGPSTAAPPNDPYVTDVVTLLADTGQMSKTTHINPQTGAAMFDQFNNVIDTWVYDYSKQGLGALLNHTHTDYLTVNNGIDYSARTSLSSPHLLSLPTRQSVYDSLESERSRTTYEYDNYTASDNFHAALKDWPAITGVAISGLDPSYSPAFLFRGNITATTRYLLANSQVTGSIKEYTQFDIAGNVVKTIDPRSTSTNIIATNIIYDDCFGSPDVEAHTNSVPDRLLQTGQRAYAFPTLTTNALGQKTYLQFDYYIGRPVDAEDANGTLYSGFYDDPFERPTKILKAGNRDLKFQSLTVFAYDDANRVITTNGDLRSYGDQVLKEQVLNDGLGRTAETRQFEGGSNFIAVRRGYDALGRTVQSSNPFRPWKGETPLWNSSAFDGLGRVESTTTADGATATTSYNGNEVVATDQIGKKRKSVADAMGRLVQIYEDPNGVNWLTSYYYDALGNLTSVNQGNQTRTFQYDSLSRLVSANNPENGNSTFTYDNAGNLLTRLDARGTVTTFDYDKMSRPVSRTYQNDPAGTPPVNYIYDAQPLPAGAPAGFARGSSIGRLVAVTYGNSSSTGDYFSFDYLGREERKVQRTGNVNYESVAEYNVSGRAISLTYPSGHVVSFNYDSAGRLGDRSPNELAISGNLAGITRTYASGLSYSNRNALAQEKLGTDTPIYNKLFYNSRGQLAEIRDSTSPNNTTWNRGAIINHYSNACWGMCAGLNMPDNNGNLKKQDHWIPDNEPGYPYQTLSQSFHYDDLNRLLDISETRYVNDTNPTQSFTQAYSYDRYGNRAINQAGTTQNAGINTSRAAVTPNTPTNRIYGPGESESNHPLINYDAAGNQTKDYYSGNGVRYDRAFDADGKLISSLANDAFGNQASTYGYDGSGARVRRTVNGQETWLVYGIEDELLAEYPANTAAAQPTKEYGYRNGQLLIVATSGTSDPATSSGPVGYWKFNENSGNRTVDASGNGHPGTLIGATWASGQTGSAAGLDGLDDFVQIGAQSALTMTSAATVSAWIYPTGPGSNSNYGGTILGKEGEYLINRAPNGNIQWVFSNSNPGFVWVNTGGVAPLNQWTHVAVTYDAGLIKTYINGVLVHTFSGAGSIGDYDGGAYNDFRIGGRQESVQHFQGRIDEARVYNRPLAANEISALINTQPSGLMGSWSFDEGSGSATADSSGQGFNGTLMSGATWATGHSNSAASFDGVNDYVQVGAQAGLSVTTAVSLSAWIFPTGPGSNPTYGGTIMGKEGEYLINRAPNGNIQWVFSNSNPGWFWVNTGGTAPLNQWTHVAVVYDAGVVKTYINGSLVHTFNGQGAITDYDGGAYNDFRIGGRQESVQHFQGRIDEVRRFNRALSATEITGLQAGSSRAIERDMGKAAVPLNTASANAEIVWLVADQLGTPRMIFDKTGSLASMKRHDYLPFGEELGAGVGQRSTSQGYSSSDGVRQKFTSKERDGESGLDYFLARHYQNAHGRFISPDPLLASGRPANPQTWNRYAYVLNNPLKFMDPSGMEEREQTLPGQTEQPVVQPPSQQPTPAPTQTSPPQDLVASIMNDLTQVTFTLNGQEGTGIMQLDQNVSDQILGALNESFTRGVETGTLASATNGLVVPTTVGTLAGVGLTATVTNNGGTVGSNLSKTAQKTYEVAAGRAVSADINNRAANGQTTSRVASQLEGAQVKINTAAGSVPGRLSRDVWRENISSAVNRVYQAGIVEGMKTVGPAQVSTKNPF